MLFVQLSKHRRVFFLRRRSSGCKFLTSAFNDFTSFSKHVLTTSLVLFETSSEMASAVISTCCCCCCCCSRVVVFVFNFRIASAVFLLLVYSDVASALVFAARCFGFCSLSLSFSSFVVFVFAFIAGGCHFNPITLPPSCASVSNKHLVSKSSPE